MGLGEPVPPVVSVGAGASEVKEFSQAKEGEKRELARTGGVHR